MGEINETSNVPIPLAYLPEQIVLEEDLKEQLRLRGLRKTIEPNDELLFWQETERLEERFRSVRDERMAEAIPSDDATSAEQARQAKSFRYWVRDQARIERGKDHKFRNEVFNRFMGADAEKVDPSRSDSTGAWKDDPQKHLPFCHPPGWEVLWREVEERFEKARTVHWDRIYARYSKERRERDAWNLGWYPGRQGNPPKSLYTFETRAQAEIRKWREFVAAADRNGPPRRPGDTRRFEHGPTFESGTQKHKREQPVPEQESRKRKREQTSAKQDSQKREREQAYSEERSQERRQEGPHFKRGQEHDVYEKSKFTPKKTKELEINAGLKNLSIDDDRLEAFHRWLLACDTIMGKGDKALIRSLNTFPEPPAWPCNAINCIKTQSERSLRACPCNIKWLFAKHENYCGSAFLKEQRRRWHPDNFSSCLIPGAQRKAEELFKVFGEIYDGKT